MSAATSSVSRSIPYGGVFPLSPRPGRSEATAAWPLASGAASEVIPIQPRWRGRHRRASRGVAPPSASYAMLVPSLASRGTTHSFIYVLLVTATIA
jgi:hypothetical protein